MRRLLRLWRTSGTDLRLLAEALHSGSRSRWLIPATALLALFAIDPFNFAIPFIGVIDDLILLPLLLRWLARAATAYLRVSPETPPARSATLLAAARPSSDRKPAV